MVAGKKRKSSPIIVVGAGIIGVSTAIELQRAGRDVLLIDRAGPAEGTSFGNGGVLAACAIVPVTGPGLWRKLPAYLLDKNAPLFLKWGYLPKLLPWALRYMAHANEQDTRRIASHLTPLLQDAFSDHQALAAGTRAEKWLHPCDYFYLYRDKAHCASDALSWDIRKENGYDFTELARPELLTYLPALGEAIGYGVKLANHGRIASPGDYVKDLAAHFIAEGGAFKKGEVKEIISTDGVITAVKLGDEVIGASQLVITTGAWSGNLARQLGVRVPLESERGYHIELWEPNMMPQMPMLIADGQFVITPMEGRLRLAGVLEFGGLKDNPSTAPFEALLYHAKRSFPSLRWAHQTRWMGHRPAIPDSLPIISEAPRIRGAFMGFGHHHVGLTGGARTGKWLAQMVTNFRNNDDMRPYQAARFSSF